MDIDCIISKLENVLDSNRLKHSINVMETAKKLAAHYGADPQKAALAGILHDCGKNYKGSDARDFALKINYKPDEVEWIQPGLLHGIIGEYLARNEYGIADEEILSAIRWHTTGHPGMTKLEKIIFIADYIEPLRKFEGIDEIRKIAYDGLDRCLLLCCDFTIRYILKKGALLHTNTIDTRNHALMLIKSNQS